MRKPSFLLFLALGAWTAPTAVEAALQVSPTAVILDSPETTQQMLVRSSASPVDLTRLATYTIADARIAVVDSAGLVMPKAEGKTTILVRHGSEQATVPLEVVGLEGCYPLWGRDSAELCREFADLGYRAVTVCVDTLRLPADRCGQFLTPTFVASLPDGVDGVIGARFR